MTDGVHLRTIKLAREDRFGWWGNDVTRIQYDPTADPANQVVELYAGGSYVGAISTGDQRDDYVPVAAAARRIIEQRRETRT